MLQPSGSGGHGEAAHHDHHAGYWWSSGINSVRKFISFRCVHHDDVYDVYDVDDHDVHVDDHDDDHHAIQWRRKSCGDHTGQRESPRRGCRE